MLDLSNVDTTPLDNIFYNLVLILVIAGVGSISLGILMKVLRIPQIIIEKVLVLSVIILVFGSIYVMSKYNLFIGS
ncbi:hypothetical protein ACWE42_16815 [Sutcliffiella cohnii]